MRSSHSGLGSCLHHHLLLVVVASHLTRRVHVLQRQWEGLQHAFRFFVFILHLLFVDLGALAELHCVQLHFKVHRRESCVESLVGARHPTFHRHSKQVSIKYETQNLNLKKD